MSKTSNIYLIEKIDSESKNPRYFHILCSIYIASMLTSMTVSARLIQVKIPFTDFSVLLTGGTWTIPLSFMIQDITTEVYGYTKSRHLIQITVIILAFYIAYLKATTLMPMPNIKNIGGSYNTVFNALPRHLFALLTAMITGNLINDYLISKTKIFFGGKYIALRFIFSGLIGEAVLQIAGTSVAWLGSLHFSSQILPFVYFSYGYKLFFSLILTPLNVFICNFLKKSEGIDVYDEKINYNPFFLKIRNT